MVTRPQHKSKSKEDNSMQDVYAEDHKRKDEGGGKRTGYLDTSEYDDVEFYNVKEGKNEIDIIPYIIATNNHPQGRSKGKLDYKLDIWVHRFVGEQEGSFVCPKETFNNPCPICEEIKKMINSQEYSWKDDEIKSLRAKRRVVYNVLDLSEDKPKIKLFDMNHFEFQKEIIEEAENGEDGFVPFADLEEGKTIVFRGSEREGKDFKKSFKPKGFKFLDRDSYDEDILKEAYPLDAMLIIASYEEIKEALFGKHSETEDEENEEESEREVKTKSKKIVVEEDDSEEEDDERNRKTSSAKKTGKTNKCPAGGKFGEDTDELKECKKCEVWDECREAYSE